MTIELKERRFFGLRQSTRELHPGETVVLEKAVAGPIILSAGRVVDVRDPDNIVVRHLLGDYIVRHVERQREEINFYDVNPAGQKTLGLRSLPIKRWDRLTRHSREITWRETNPTPTEALAPVPAELSPQVGTK